MAIRIQTDGSVASAGDTHCVCIQTSSGSTPQVGISIDGGPWMPLSLDPLGGGKFVACFPVPPGAGGIKVAATDSAGSFAVGSIAVH